MGGGIFGFGLTDEVGGKGEKVVVLKSESVENGLGRFQ